jgi:hypothetical protein
MRGKKTKRTKRANPTRTKYYRWTVEIEVHETWVEDGFDLTPKNVHDRVHALLPNAYGHEVRARVLSRPPRAAIRKAQGG